MRVFLLHADDDFPASRSDQRWDLVIDLAVEVQALQSWRPLLEHGIGHVVDRFGIDWWDVISLQLEPELQDVRLALRLAERLKGCTELTVSRRSSIAEMVGIQLGIPL